MTQEEFDDVLKQVVARKETGEIQPDEVQLLENPGVRVQIAALTMLARLDCRSALIAAMCMGYVFGKAIANAEKTTD